MTCSYLTEFYITNYSNTTITAATVQSSASYYHWWNPNQALLLHDDSALDTFSVHTYIM